MWPLLTLYAMVMMWFARADGLVAKGNFHVSLHVWDGCAAPQGNNGDTDTRSLQSEAAQR